MYVGGLQTHKNTTCPANTLGQTEALLAIVTLVLKSGEHTGQIW